MDDDTFQGVVYKLAQDAEFHIDHDVAPQRIKATQFYNAEPLGDEEDGRSQFVLSVVRDATNAILPSLHRVFMGSEHAVEFVPTNEAEVQMAKDATDAVNHIFWNKCHGFSQVLEPAFQDALIRGAGVLYWWFEKKERVREFTVKGLTEEEMDLYVAHDPDDIEIVSKEECECEDYATPHQADPLNPAEDPAVASAVETVMSTIVPEMLALDPTAQISIEIPKTYNFRIRRTTREPVAMIKAIPPEQFIINRSATHEGDSLCIGRRQVVTVSDLVSTGFDLDEILENCGTSPIYSVGPTNMEAEVRDPALLWGRYDNSGDDSLRQVLYSELFVKIDRDQDGVAELWRVQTLGEHHYILHAEIYEDDEPPFALLCPFPTAHKALGESLAERLIDLQSIESRIWRNTLDSFASSIFPRMAVVEGQVNLDDVLSNEVGAVIRMRTPGAVQEIGHTFLGAQAMGLLQQLQQVKAERTGVSAASQGLDPEVLQSTTASAVAATTSAADQTAEIIARRFADGMKRAFSGLLRTICRHFDEPLDIRRSDGTTTQIDPRQINPDLLVSTNTGLGKGKDSDRLQMFANLLQYQQMIIQAVGPNGPVGPQEIRNTIASMMNIAGIKDVSKYIKPIPLNYQPPNPQQAPNPQMYLAQGQIQNDQIKLKLEMQKMQLEHERQVAKMQMDMALEREKLAQERVLQLATIQAQYGSQLQQAEMDRELDIEKAHINLTGQMMQQDAAHSHEMGKAHFAAMQQRMTQQADQAHAADEAHLDRLAGLHTQDLQQSHAADMQASQQAADAAMTPDSGASDDAAPSV
ncbi:hypothetical protein FF100_22105 [Methylobacterium terricola]|uniref:Phage P22-like portal protein n=1 Tax=Methylobacterium terricola TaxID=2583531 RepID=A0A5C4LFB3_9HYPH|nr:hypothetical protein [Methylobacterium terricola]TNC10847.1 hypothetical protein FF100_22105 [Methylobacterium terricola]